QVGQAPDATDQQLARLETGQGHPMLKGVAGRLATQQACPFRAQAQYRLGAEPPATLSAGVPHALRGRLLHLLLEHLWQELADQAGLLTLDLDTQQSLLARCWTVALRLTPAARWLPLPVLERERARAFETVARVLDLERSRPPFTVKQRESTATWTGAGAHLSLRIDRIDETQGEAVLIDYKSGAPTRIQLQEDALQPLQ